jgi:hypothetical protein
MSFRPPQPISTRIQPNVGQNRRMLCFVQPAKISTSPKPVRPSTDSLQSDATLSFSRQDAAERWQNQAVYAHERHANDSFHRTERFMAPAVLKASRSLKDADKQLRTDQSGQVDYAFP